MSRNKRKRLAEEWLKQALKPARLPTLLTVEQEEVLELRLRMTELRERLTVSVRRRGKAKQVEAM